MYYTGAGVTRDTTLGARYCRRAADNGYAQSQNTIGKMFLIGDVIPQNLELAEHYFKLAIAQGHVRAMVNLGQMYLTAFGIPNYERAATYFKLAAEKGDAEGQFELGKLYIAGNGVECLPQVGYRLIIKAAQQNFPAARKYLGEKNIPWID